MAELKKFLKDPVFYIPALFLVALDIVKQLAWLDTNLHGFHRDTLSQWFEGGQSGACREPARRAGGRD